MSDDVQAFLEGASALHAQKNEDYGDAWLEVGHMMARMADGPVTLETPEDFASIGLFWERLIKVQRAFHGEFNADALHFESVRDSHEDAINYAAMHAALQAQRDGGEE